MRLFVSIDFPVNILEQVRSWLPDQKGWEKVKKHQMHLTLAFLGDCSEGEQAEIHRRLSEIEFRAFTSTISGISAFPGESAPRVIWAAVQPDHELMNLQGKISGKLKDFMKSKETQSYIPHITLARKKSRKGINQIVKQNLQRDTPVLNTYIEAFNLKQSILKSSGSEHHILHRYAATNIQ